MEEIQNKPKAEPVVRRQRPLMLTVFCLWGFVYFGLLSLLFIAGLAWSGFLRELVQKYASAGIFRHADIWWILLTATVLHLAGISATLMIWLLKKKGYFLLVLVCFSVLAIQLFLPGVGLLSPIVYLIFIIMFGLFYRLLS